ncbi:MAG: hypothetical protein K8U57_03925 [Planctomycetes bacterium]|nr:hypothetical protein [Planctomycetota bacterium]
MTGKVTYNGTPLPKPGGTIVFVSTDGTQTPAAIEQDGTYAAKAVPAGANRVAVYYPATQSQGGKPLMKRKKGEKPGSPNPVAPEPFLTPAKYAAVDTSGLSVEACEGAVLNVDMTGPKIP